MNTDGQHRCITDPGRLDLLSSTDSEGQKPDPKDEASTFQYLLLIPGKEVRAGANV